MISQLKTKEKEMEKQKMDEKKTDEKKTDEKKSDEKKSENTLSEKIKTKEFKIGILGMGYVGLPLACEFASSNIQTVGFDINRNRIEMLSRGKSHIQDIDDKTIEKNTQMNKLTFSFNFSELSNMDVITICVPTPLRKTKEPDMSYIISAIKSIQKILRKGQLVILESTTYPGTTDELILPILEETGLKLGDDFYLAFSPERVDPGNKVYTTTNTPKVVGGITTRCTQLATKVYETIIDQVVPVSSTKAAELVKLLENTFRSVNIGMANEMALICDKLGVDVWEVIDAAATKPFGFMPFYPGPGLGGHCIPIDPLYLSWRMKSLNFEARFIALAEEINTKMPDQVVKKVILGLNKIKKSVNDSKILILGVAYKSNINDIRESPAFDVMSVLDELGAKLQYHDQYVKTIKLRNMVLNSIELNKKTIQEYDCVVITTHHAYFDIDMIVKNAKVIIDSRNATKSFKNRENIIKL